MNRLPKLQHLQLNLLLVDAPKVVVPDEKQKELAMALMELLIQAAQERDASNGGGDEHEADC